jgi:hypothetical protein
MSCPSVSKAYDRTMAQTLSGHVQRVVPDTCPAPNKGTSSLSHPLGCDFAFGDCLQDLVKRKHQIAAVLSDLNLETDWPITLFSRLR